MSLAVLISEAFELYRLEYIVYNNQSAKTEEMHTYAMKSLIGFVGDVPITELTFDHVRKWKNDMERRCGQNTVRGYIIKLRVVLKHLAVKGYTGILNHEMVGIPKKSNKVVEFLTPAEVTKMIEASFKPVRGYRTLNKLRNRAIISLLYSSGIRVTELCNLDTATLREDMSFTVIGKGNKPRLCFFDERAKIYIDAYLAMRDDNNQALFISHQTGRRMDRSGVEEVFQFTAKRAGFTKQVTPHTMRHSYATNLLRNNTNLLYLKTFLGHASVQTTEMYTHVVDEDLRRIYLEKHTI